MLNKKQKLIYQKAINHVFNSSYQTYEFAGYAGTGKSYLLSCILKELQRRGIKKHEIAVMTFSGQAAMVLRMKGLTNAKTIHSWLYMPTIVDKVEEENGQQITLYDDYYGTPKKTLIFDPLLKLEGIKVIIIDEAYQVPEYIRKDIDRLGIKVIACGDSGQLPPTEGNPGYLTDPNIDILDEIMRQKYGSNIIYIADRCRKGLPLLPGFYNDVLIIERKDLNYNMLCGSDIVLCATNKTKNYFNTLIRRDLFGIKSDLPVMYDRMICKKNNWHKSIMDIALANGLTGTVVSSPDANQFDGINYTMDFKPDFLSVPFKELKCNYEFLMTQDQKVKQRIKAIRNRGIQELFEYNYASTTYSAQGSQYANGIYIEEFFYNAQNQLNYTGITRFKNSAIYVLPNRKKYW